MRVAAVYDIHANLPALEAVLAEIRREGVDCTVVGGDVLPGPMPHETLECLVNLDVPAEAYPPALLRAEILDYFSPRLLTSPAAVRMLTVPIPLAS